MTLDHAYIDAHDLAARYLDDALEPELRADFEAHLASCEECQDRLELARLMQRGAREAEYKHKQAVLDHNALDQITTKVDDSYLPPSSDIAEPRTPEKTDDHGALIEQDIDMEKKNASEAARNLARAIDWGLEPEEDTAHSEASQEESSQEEATPDAAKRAEATEPEAPTEHVPPRAQPEESTAPAQEEAVEPPSSAEESVAEQDRNKPLPEIAETTPPAATEVSQEPSALEAEGSGSTRQNVPPGSRASVSPTAEPKEEPLKIQLVTQFKPWQITFLLIAAGGILIALLTVILVLETSQ